MTTLAWSRPCPIGVTVVGMDTHGIVLQGGGRLVALRLEGSVRWSVPCTPFDGSSRMATSCVLTMTEQVVEARGRRSGALLWRRPSDRPAIVGPDDSIYLSRTPAGSDEVVLERLDPLCGDILEQGTVAFGATHVDPSYAVWSSFSGGADRGQDYRLERSGGLTEAGKRLGTYRIRSIVGSREIVVAAVRHAGKSWDAGVAEVFALDGQHAATVPCSNGGLVAVAGRYVARGIGVDHGCLRVSTVAEDGSVHDVLEAPLKRGIARHLFLEERRVVWANERVAYQSALRPGVEPKPVVEGVRVLSGLVGDDLLVTNQDTLELHRLPPLP